MSLYFVCKKKKEHVVRLQWKLEENRRGNIQKGGAFQGRLLGSHQLLLSLDSSPAVHNTHTAGPRGQHHVASVLPEEGSNCTTLGFEPGPLGSPGSHPTPMATDWR